MRRLQCPYHAWCYGFDGSAQVSAPHTEEIEDFDPADIGLTAVRMEERPRPPVRRRLRHRRPARRPPRRRSRSTSSATASASCAAPRAITYDVAANWKAIVENYSECLHCPGVHPELNRLSHYMSGDEYEGAGAWCGGSMTLNEGAETMAPNGGHGRRPAIAGLTEAEQRDVLYFALFPNLLVSLHPDYVMVHTLWPRGAGRTEVVCEWFFEPETMAQPGFDAGRRGRVLGHGQPPGLARSASSCSAASARAATCPGRYTETEQTVHAFDQLVAEAYLRAVTRARRRASGSSTRPSSGSRATGSTRCGSPASRWTRGVSTALVHYHFATREALLAEALEHSFETAGDVRDGAAAIRPPACAR